MRASARHGLFVVVTAIGAGCSGAPDPFVEGIHQNPSGADASSPSNGDAASTEAVDASTNPPDSGEPSNDAGEDAGGVPPAPAKTRKIKDLTGTQTSSGRFGVGGTDLGIAVRQPNGKIAYIFGDTFGGDGVGIGDWRSPVLLRSEPGNLGAGISFNGAAGGQRAKQILDYQHNTSQWSTWLPSDVITIGQRMYLHYIVNKGLGQVQWTQIAYSDDNGETWTVSNARWEAGENNSLRQLWTWERGTDGYVYILSTKFISRDRGIILHRVPEGKILEKAAYEPWGFKDGKWGWGNPTTEVLTGKTGEMCLRRIENKWVLAWFNAGDYDISIKVFDSPTSNLFTAKTYKPIKGTGWGYEDDTHVAQLYGGYIHPDSTLHEMHLIVSQWNTTEGANNWPYRAMQFVTGVEKD